VIQVNKGDDQESCGEGKESKEADSEAEFQEEGHGKPAGERLHQGIPPGDLGPAAAAFSPQEEKADQGDIVVPPHRCAALGAEGTGRDDGETLGQTINTHVQEAADAAAQSENKKNMIPEIHRSYIPPEVPLRLWTTKFSSQLLTLIYSFP